MGFRSIVNSNRPFPLYMCQNDKKSINIKAWRNPVAWINFRIEIHFSLAKFSNLAFDFPAVQSTNQKPC